jgi:hypothetical protein
MASSNIAQLKDPIFKIPKYRDHHYFPDLLTDIFQAYLQKLDSFTGSVREKLIEKRPLIEEICNSLVQALEAYYKGFSAQAYYELEKGLKPIADDLLYFREEFNNISPKHLYRLRVGAESIFSKQEMFHAPFELREIITTERYSILGLPSLYLSNSTYACWEELGRPNIHTIQIARYEIDPQAIKLLDLTFTPDYLQHLINIKAIKTEEVDEVLAAYLMTWPLVAACSFKANNKKAIFKPEYIIPQLTLQWVRLNRNVHGIKYCSNCDVHDYKSSPFAFINVVIPAHKIKKEGFCSFLTKHVKLTETVSWQIVTLAHPGLIQNNETSNTIENDEIPLSADELELIKGEKQPYLKTVFGKMEIQLSQMKAENLM